MSHLNKTGRPAGSRNRRPTKAERDAWMLALRERAMRGEPDAIRLLIDLEKQQ